MINPTYAVKASWLGSKMWDGSFITPGKQQFFKLEVYTLVNSSYVLSNTFSSNKALVDDVNIKTLDVVLNSISISKSICQDSEFLVQGNVTAASMSFTAVKGGEVDSVLKTLSGSYYLKAYMTIDGDEAFMGYFEVSSREVNLATASYIFSDFLDRLDQVYYVFKDGIKASTHLTAIWAKVYSETGCEFFNSLCPASWGTQSDDWIHVKKEFYNVSTGYQCTCREALKYIGEYTGKSFIITEDDNTREFGCEAGESNGNASFTSSNYHAVIKDLVFSEEEITIGKYRFYYSETGFVDKNFVNPSYSLVFSNNPLIGDATRANRAANMYHGSITTLPGELRVVNYPYVEPYTRVLWGRNTPYKGFSIATRVVYKLNGVMQIFFAGPKRTKQEMDLPSNIKDFRYTIPGTISQTAGSGKTSTSGTVTISLPSEFTNGLSSASYVVMVTPTASASSVLYVTGKTTTQFVVHGPASCNFDWFTVKV